MIKELRVTDPSAACTPWWKEVEGLKGRDRIEFEPGLNIIWGPNGSGKSTVITALARMLHCEQGGTQLVTSTSMHNLRGSMRNGIPDGVMPIHDGQPVVYFDPGNRVGLIGGAFDWDFGDMGLRNTAFRGSHGQTTMMRAETALVSIIKNTPPPKASWKMREPSANPPSESASDYDKQRWQTLDTVRRILAGTEKDSGRFTCLLDEPDRSLDIPLQFRYWLKLAEAVLVNDVQIIAASHSVFALDLPGVNYIEFKPGYLEQCRHTLRAQASTYLDEMISERETRRGKKAE